MAPLSYNEAMGVPRRSINFGYLTLTCLCGASVEGKVRSEGVQAAVALFEAHHQGKRCKPSYGIKDVETMRVERTPRLTPQSVCASAWWVPRR
jgi:hypothetical protein